MEAGGVIWHIQQFGQGPLLLLVHGTAASTHSWRGLAPLLASRHSVLSLDLPGHAFSGLLPRQAMSIANVANSIGALLRKLEVSPDLAIGHSAGAAILVRMCRDGAIAPRYGVVSLNGALLPFEGFPGRLFMPLAKMLTASPLAASLFSWRASSLTAVERVISGTGSKIDPVGLEFYARLFRNPSHLSAALSMMANWNLDGTVDDIARLSLPVLQVACGGDLAVPAEAAFQVQCRAPRLEIKYIRHLGHLAHEEQPEVIADIIAARLLLDSGISRCTDLGLRPCSAEHDHVQ